MSYSSRNIFHKEIINFLTYLFTYTAPQPVNAVWPVPHNLPLFSLSRLNTSSNSRPPGWYLLLFHLVLTYRLFFSLGLHTYWNTTLCHPLHMPNLSYSLRTLRTLVTYIRLLVNFIRISIVPTPKFSIRCTHYPPMKFLRKGCWNSNGSK